MGVIASEPMSRHIRTIPDFLNTIAAITRINRPATMAMAVLNDRPLDGVPTDFLKGETSGNSISFPTHTRMAYVAGSLSGLTPIPKSPVVFNYIRG